MAEFTSSRASAEAVADQAIESVREQRTRLLEDGVSAVAFFVGVVNVAFSGFLIGRWPQYYWVYNCLKGFLLFPMRISRQAAQGTLFYNAELCWVTNFVLLALLAVVATDELITGEIIPQAALRQGFLLFWMLGTGPLGWSIAALGNALIFHSIDHTANLNIHVGPLLSLWCLRTSAPTVQAAFPALGTMLIGLDEHAPDPWSEMLRPALAFYLGWWLIYTAWLMTTMFQGKATEVLSSSVARSLEPAVHSVLSGLTRNSTRSVLLCYCMVHLVSCTASFCFAVLMFLSIPLFTVFCVAMLLAAAWNGASRYNYYLVDVYAKRLHKAIADANGEGSASHADAKAMV